MIQIVWNANKWSGLISRLQSSEFQSFELIRAHMSSERFKLFDSYFFRLTHHKFKLWGEMSESTLRPIFRKILWNYTHNVKIHIYLQCRFGHLHIISRLFLNTISINLLQCYCTIEMDLTNLIANFQLNIKLWIN
jgi:hypothetical protein